MQMFLITLAKVDAAILSCGIGRFLESKPNLFTDELLTQVLSSFPCIWLIFSLLRTDKTVIIIAST